MTEDLDVLPGTDGAAGTAPSPSTQLPRQARRAEDRARGDRRKPAVASLDLVIPAYNEEGRIGPTLEAICRQIAASPYRVRILVVDNGSVDATADTVDRVVATGVRVEVIGCKDKGKGAAVRAGVAHATAEYVGYVDADQSTPPDALLTGMAILTSGWDAVIGSRRALGARYVVPQPVVRRLGSRVFNMAASTVVGRISDTQCGMKLFRTAAAREVFAAARLTGFAFDVEILARCNAAGLKIMELPVEWSDDEGSTLRPVRDGLSAFAELYRVRRMLRAGR